MGRDDVGEAFCKELLGNELWKLRRRDPNKGRPGLMSFLSHTRAQYELTVVTQRHHIHIEKTLISKAINVELSSLIENGLGPSLWSGWSVSGVTDSPRGGMKSHCDGQRVRAGRHLYT